MRVKKFDCHQCGAPKVSAVKNPYVVCDYCGYMIDVDYAVGLEVWKESLNHTAQYIQRKVQFETKTKKYLAENNKEAYWQETYDFWDYYYTHYPQYLPPTVSKGEKYKLFIQSAADMAADTMGTDEVQAQSEAYKKANAELQYYKRDEKMYVNYAAFSKMIAAYLDFQSKSFRIVYDNPKYAIMHEVMPEQFQLKMKLSQIAQVWIPYLEEKDADAFLTQYKLKQEYVEIGEPVLQTVVCEDCKKELSVPEGALVCVCEHCRQENILKKVANCHDCGYENELPKDWKQMIKCGSCGSQLRVVQPLFSGQQPKWGK